MNGRDKRRRVKSRRGDGTTRGRGASQAHNPAGTIVLDKASEPVHGKHCRIRNAKIDISVCTVQSARSPQLCEGCV
jgi:hypothetical protein